MLLAASSKFVKVKFIKALSKSSDVKKETAISIFSQAVNEIAVKLVVMLEFSLYEVVVVVVAVLRGDGGGGLSKEYCSLLVVVVVVVFVGSSLVAVVAVVAFVCSLKSFLFLRFFGFSSRRRVEMVRRVLLTCSPAPTCPLTTVFTKRKEQNNTINLLLGIVITECVG